MPTCCASRSTAPRANDARRGQTTATSGLLAEAPGRPVNWPSAVLHAHPLTVVISIQGAVPAGSEASLISLLPLIDERLRASTVRSG